MPCSLLYSQFGSLSFQKILLNRNFESIAGTVLILLYILFKFGLVPFHTWLLDVYEKLSFLTVMFLDTVWKLFLTFIFLKIFSIFIINKFYDPQLLFEIIAIISMAFGAIIPIFQNNINKFIATSSIGHLGFIFSVFATMKSLNQSTDMMCYLVYYSISSICFFIGILFINKHQTIRNFSDLAGIINTTPLIGILILLSIFSMIGIPPFGNFIAKLNIFKLLLQSKSYLLLSISAIYSILAILYTAKLSKFFFTKTNNPIFIESSKIKSIIPILVLISFALFYSKVELLFSNIISRM
ncbi:MAG: proton-conducting transporter membrane subunit [Alphaproteobacteria bacterium]|nr:proton-conducting transporter membrane subunit [Alphaproteobacteria bacterium]